MDTLFKHITNSICHAFNALHQDVPGLVHKSKLKVLTANIATLFDLYGIEKGLDHYRSTITLNFEHFRYYLLQELFTTLSASSITVPELRNYESKIEEICWLVCRKQYLTINNNLNTINLFNEHYLYKLFRIFCMLGELNGIDNNERCWVKLHQSEMDLLLQQLVSSMGLDYDNDNHNHNQIFAARNQKQSYCFEEFLDKLNFNNYNKTTIELTKESILEAIDEMYQTYINDIIKKGYLLRRGYLLPTLKEYWFVLQPYQLLYYKNKNQKDLCGTIILDSNCMVRSSTIPNNSQWNTKKSISSSPSTSTSSSLSSSSTVLPLTNLTASMSTLSNSTSLLSSTSPSPLQSQSPISSTSSTNIQQQSSSKQVKILKFSLSTNDRTFEMATKDHRSRLQWIAALQLAITYSMGKEGYQRDQLAKRQKRREYELNCKQADDIQRTNQLKEVELTKTQLEQEKLARLAAERDAQQLKIVAIEDSRRVAELEDVKHTLESLLREETQAKHDEEIVRALQARVLAEEWEKREELESLQEEQRHLLALERQKRYEFEQKQKDKEKHLLDAKQKLLELECERQRLDMELKQARIKIMQSEENKELLEARLRTINGRTLIRDDNTAAAAATTNNGGGDFRIRRSLSFMCTNRERTNQ